MTSGTNNTGFRIPLGNPTGTNSARIPVNGQTTQITAISQQANVAGSQQHLPMNGAINFSAVDDTKSSSSILQRMPVNGDNSVQKGSNSNSRMPVNGARN